MNIEEPQSVIETPQEVVVLEGFQYYWCVNCGHSGNFKRVRIKGLNCQSCMYEHLTPFTVEEIMADPELQLKFGL